MRHRKDHRKLSRTAAHRRSLLRNLTTSLFQHERIETTLAKAKETQPFVEKLITLARGGFNLNDFRRALAVITKKDVCFRLFHEIGPRYATRPGGYTRIIRLGSRLGDAGETAYLELIKSEEQREKERQERMSAEEAKEKALKAGAPGKKAKAGAAEGEKPKPGRRHERESGVTAPSRKRTRTGVKTG